MAKKNYYLKYFLPRLELWAFFCGLFGLFFILARVNFEGPTVERIFIFVWIFYMLATGFFSIFFHGGARLLKINLEHKDAFLINTHIIDGHIDSKISDKKLKKLFHILKKESVITVKRRGLYFGLLVSLSVLTMYYIGTSVFNLIIILAGGLISFTILALFSIFSTEISFVNNLLRECRQMLKKRGIKPNEEIQLFTLEKRFSYFIILLFLVVVTILSFVPRPSLFILIFLILSFIMTVIISRMLFTSIYSVFQEIEDFATELPQKEKAEYYTGSSYEEVLDLSKNLNRSAREIYVVRAKEKKIKRELQEKVNELNKWFRVTIGRELKMVELKKEIKKLQEEKKRKNSS
jgi:hypothetical protein